MAPAAITPESSGAATPTTATASSLTEAGIKHQMHGFEAPLDASKIKRMLTSAPRPVPSVDSPEAMAKKTCTDHMITARWTQAAGWETPLLRPYGALEIMPSASVLHYATECFEGMKLYRGVDGQLRLFRPGRNCERMRRSAARIALPDFPAAELERMIVALCGQDGSRWLPRAAGPGFLYVRPTMIGTDAALGVQRPDEALLYVIIAVFPDMSRNMTDRAEGGEEEPAGKGMRLVASSEDTIRAWPGGFGHAKVGANYGPTLMASGEAKRRGFDQVLWLFGQEGFVTEAGSSNFFVVWRSKETGRLQLVTAPLEERIILDGITRASILQLARERLSADANGLEGLEVVERRFTMAELLAAHAEGRLIEAFAVGTAVFVAPIGLIEYRGTGIQTPLDGDSGVYARQLKQWISDIMYGKESHEWGVVIPEA